MAALFHLPANSLLNSVCSASGALSVFSRLILFPGFLTRAPLATRSSRLSLHLPRSACDTSTSSLQALAAALPRRAAAGRGTPAPSSVGATPACPPNPPPHLSRIPRLVLCQSPEPAPPQPLAARRGFRQARIPPPGFSPPAASQISCAGPN